MLRPTGHRCAAAETAQLPKEAVHFFESKIRPLLVDHCYECHSERSGESEGGLLMDRAAAIRKGGSLGPALRPGSPEASLIFLAVGYKHSQLQMPPTEKLDDESIELLRQWIAMGAPDPRTGTADQPSGQTKTQIDGSSHWAYHRPQRLTIESSETDSDDVDVIDHHARKLAAERQVNVSPRADDQTLIRRLFYDLTGLPPDQQQIQQFVQSTRADKFETLVDELLATPEYAERMARHWMDVARYADTIGYATGGKERRLKGSERYRDWLIRALAIDMPYDEMIRLQLSADRYDPSNEQGNLDAMGFLTVGRRFLNRYDTIDDRIDVITRGLLGMTVTCARCHDHKFDPIPTSDYYSLLGILESSEQKFDGPSPLMMIDKKDPKDSQIFLRGQPAVRGDVAPRQYLTALRPKDDTPFSDGSGRYELANRIASPDNPLVARVLVNRLWGILVGRPFVDSTSDFGIRTEAPVLVGVLDELAAEFSRHWSIKRLVRRIVTSRVYCQSSDPVNESALINDPENRLAARGNRKRRDFESMRDSMLVACDWLDRTVGGPSVDIHLATPVPRRSVYAMVDRQNLPSLFRTFDFASPDAHTPRRFHTTVPQQALYLMNHPQMGSLASTLAKTIRSEHSDAPSQVDTVFRRTLSRDPSPIERQESIQFVSQSVNQRSPQFDPRRAWQYGTATANAECRVDDFTPLPHFTGSSWQSGPTLPADNELKYASLGMENGHPGPNHAVVRRWKAPQDGVVTVSGMVGHRNKKGDGIQLALWIGGVRVWKEVQKSNNRPFSRLKGRIRKGQHVDFVASPGQSDSFDSFFLRCQISLASGNGNFFEGDSKRDFSGPLPESEPQSLDRLAQLAQVLLMSNEFLFVD